MRRFRAPLTLLCAFLLLATTGSAQNAVRIDPPTGRLGWLTHPYEARIVPPINLSNSSRLETLIRAGNLYLTAPDVVALAIENNIDIEVQRYGPLLAREVLRRAQGGGACEALAWVSPPAPSVSLHGVSINTGARCGRGGRRQFRRRHRHPARPRPFPPSILAFTFIANFAARHLSAEQHRADRNHRARDRHQTLQAQYSQTWAIGLNAPVDVCQQPHHVNSNFFALNPFTSGDLDLQLTQNLLNGFGGRSTPAISASRRTI